MEFPKTVFFDLDGTLADNYDAITAGVTAAIVPMGFEAPTREKIKKTVGGSIILTMEKLVGPELAEKAANAYMAAIPDLTFFGLRAMPHAREILEGLREIGVDCACLTNKSQKAAEEIIEKLEMSQLLKTVIGTTLLGPHKPAPEFTAMAMEMMQAQPQTSLMVGDSRYDYLTGENAAMGTLLVATGGDTAEELAKACPNALGIFSNLKDMAANFFKL